MQEVINQNKEAASRQTATAFSYEIKGCFRRFYSSTGLKIDEEWNEFEVTLVIGAVRGVGDRVGLNTVKAEKALHMLINEIPQAIGDMPECPNGTIEELCEFFAGLSQVFDSRSTRLLAVKLAESGTRSVVLNLSRREA